MKNNQWKKVLKTWARPTKYPGVWERKEGGYIVRARVLDPTTGRMREVRRVLPSDCDALRAHTWLQEEVTLIKQGQVAAAQPRPRFSDYSVSLLERKTMTREIKSARGRERWAHTVRHLIVGTGDVTGFGDMFMEQISVGHVEAWRTGIAKLIAADRYAPTTANGWLHILRHIMKRAKRELGLALDPTDGIPSFDTSEHVTYTEEEPNALSPEEAQGFLACMRETFPQHYAMTYLGFATGLRPSSMRPLRRRGDTPDIRWDEGVILVRRSHTLGDEVMETTKTKLRQRITVPTELIDVLCWHVRTQLETPEQQASDLLFPAEDGGFRSESCLKKAFAEVRASMGLKKRFTPSGMRRTFNDAARLAQVGTLLTRSISGHQTEKMHQHYSTVSGAEQRDSIGRVLGLVVASDFAIPSGGNGGGKTPPGGGNCEETTR